MRARAGNTGRLIGCAILSALVTLLPGAGALAGDKPSSSKSHELHYFRVLRQGKELSFYGEIVAGVAKELDALLKAHPDATVLHLNSPGGSVHEARRMSVLVTEARIATITDSYCNSACVIVFLGASQRYMTPDARIGFHHESMEDGTAAEIAASEKFDKTFMASRGVPKAFLEKAFSTPAADIWTPTTKELTDAKVITDISRDFAMAGYAGNSDGEVVDSLLAASHLFSPLKTADPERFATVRAALVGSLGASDSYGKFFAVYDGLVDGVFSDYLVRARDEQLMGYVREEVAVIRSSLAKNPASCALVSDHEGGFYLHIESGGDLDYSKYNAAKADAIKDGAQHPVGRPSQTEVETARAALRLAFRARHADEVEAMSDPSSTKLGAGVGCHALADYLDTSLTLPRPEAANFMRYYYSTEPDAEPIKAVAEQPHPRALPIGSNKSN